MGSSSFQSTEKIWSIIPAAGLGRRMGSEQPKQYLPLSGKTVIEHTLEKLLQVEKIAGVVVAIHQRDQQFNRLPLAKNKKIFTAHGGNERSDSVLSALNSLQKKAKLNDWILVHDAARCCVRIEDIENLISVLAEDQVGGILGVSSSDTLKQVSSSNTIQLTLDRTTIWQAQTPQLFRYGLLRDALQSAIQKGQVITDEASAVELAGYKPQIVEGHTDNIKVTHPEDLEIAAMILKRQGLV
jgi:2-C-methyl-D-erythritol 4-phosphate cytidylyltransferase